MVNKKISHTKVCDIFYESINIRLFHLLKANFIKKRYSKNCIVFLVEMRRIELLSENTPQDFLRV